MEELEFLEMEELFVVEAEDLCANCKWRNYTAEDGTAKQCSLIIMLNKLASKRGALPLDDSFSCNRWVEIPKPEEAVV